MCVGSLGRPQSIFASYTSKCGGGDGTSPAPLVTLVFTFKTLALCIWSNKSSYKDLFQTMASKAIQITDLAAWKQAFQSRSPVLVHLNADTTWLIQLPYPSSAASSTQSYYNILIDPWLQGPQSDVASWFSTQWHVEAPTVQTMDELNSLLLQLEEREGGSAAIDAVVISHEFTDHCHQATLLELSKQTPVFATDKAAELIRSWTHFESVVTMPGFSGANQGGLQVALGDELLPAWLGIGRVVTAGNALYYHSAVLIAFNRHGNTLDDTGAEGGSTEAIVYSAHGIKGSDLECLKPSGINTLALLHGLHDMRIWMTAQLNLGALNGIQAVRACGAKYWIATHDETKRGGGFISWLLRRTTYTLRDAVEAEEVRLMVEDEGKALTESSYDFVELGSGEALALQ